MSVQRPAEEGRGKIVHGIVKECAGSWSHSVGVSKTIVERKKSRAVERKSESMRDEGGKRRRIRG